MIICQKRKSGMNDGSSYNEKGKIVFPTRPSNVLSIKDFKTKVKKYLGVNKWSKFSSSIQIELDHGGNVKKETLKEVVKFLDTLSNRKNTTVIVRDRVRELSASFKRYC